MTTATTTPTFGPKSRRRAAKQRVAEVTAPTTHGLKSRRRAAER